jgi:hypothetical protein
VNVVEPLATMLLKVTGFEPVEVFFTVTTAFAVEFTTMLLNVTLEGVKLSVGAAANAQGTISNAPASSATILLFFLFLSTDICAERNLWAMELKLINGLRERKVENLAPDSGA